MLILLYIIHLSLSEEDYEVSPTNNRFVKASIRRGLLPEVLEDLLSARKRAKKDLKVEEDPFRYSVNFIFSVALPDCTFFLGSSSIFKSLCIYLHEYE